ncbi:undecaprenyl/decaprenyl-phosphate alpha-N-acetylglucosaminyl 1-phosphate transferase [Bacteroidales bacterium OttesenSCG-928-M06]|nr:undecaprenyl/decaprenyl-phosphate alpha-N-acetylglucosaminyl 1-phosphate transferase [Bacteroidales bacterium OttesenSCG-928-M06]
MSLNIIIAFFLSITISAFVTYKVIRFSQKLGWGDDPSEKRKIHKKRIPNLGGFAVFIATMVTYFAFSDYTNTVRPDKLFSISIFLFFIGVRDDMDGISARSRLLFEFICAFFIIYITDIRMTTLWGIFGVSQISIFTSYILTSIFIVGCINAYNLIDGIDGLLGSLSLLGAICFGLIFNFSGEWLWTLLCVAMSGALLGFLLYNWSPAKIFMGNGGALFLGTIFACFSLRVMQLLPVNFSEINISMPHTMAIGIVSIPLMDMLMVSLLRIVRKKPPFSPDNRHIHHVLLDMGLGHRQSTLLLIMINIIIIAFAYFIQDTGALRSLLFTIAFAFSIELVIRFIARMRIRTRYKKSIV